MTIEQRTAPPAEPVLPLDVPAPEAMPVARERRSGGRLLFLDLVRLGAALLVVVYHFGPQLPLNSNVINFVMRHGFLGVELFFLVSGFVICMSSWGRTVSEFFTSRVTRLYPAYWFCVILSTAVVAVWPIFLKPLRPKEILANLTMVQEWLFVPHVDKSYWTLLVELQFYLLFALFVVRRGTSYRRVVTFCGLWLLASMVAPWISAAWVGKFLAANYSAYFIAGTAFFLIYRYGSTLLLWGLVAVAYVVAMVQLPGIIAFAELPYATAVIVVSSFFALMAAVSLHWFEWFRWRGAVTIGALTYPLYLIHQNIGLTIIMSLDDKVYAWPLFLSTIGVLLLASYLIHRLVERPVARVLKRQLTRSFAAARRAV